MKILMLTPYLPYPPSSGGQIRSYNLIKQLARNHQITLCSLIKHESDRKYVSQLEKYCQKVYIFKRSEKPWTLTNIISTAFSLFPFLVIRNFSPSEKKELPSIISNGNFDLIHAETFYVSPHIPQTDIPIVLVDQTIESEVYQHFVKNFKLFFLRPILYIDVLKLKYWERYYWKKAARVIAVSEKDLEVMKKILKQEKVTLIPNGVGEDLMEKVDIHYSKTVLFVGNYAWLQNVEAAKVLTKEIFPLIIKEVSDAKLLIVGQNTNRLTNLESEKVEIVDLAVDDTSGIKSAFRESGVLVAPLYGPGGTRLKILGSMASMVPVVTTKVGNAGIGEDGETVLLGENSEELAKKAIQLLTDTVLYQRIAEKARKLVEEKYSYEAISKLLTQVYQEVVSSK